MIHNSLDSDDGFCFKVVEKAGQWHRKQSFSGITQPDDHT